MGSGQKKNKGEVGHCAVVWLLRSRPGGRSASQGRAGVFSEHALYSSARLLGCSASPPRTTKADFLLSQKVVCSRGHSSAAVPPVLSVRSIHAESLLPSAAQSKDGDSVVGMALEESRAVPPSRGDPKRYLALLRLFH